MVVTRSMTRARDCVCVADSMFFRSDCSDDDDDDIGDIDDIDDDVVPEPRFDALRCDGVRGEDGGCGCGSGSDADSFVPVVSVVSVGVVAVVIVFDGVAVNSY